MFLIVIAVIPIHLQSFTCSNPGMGVSLPHFKAPQANWITARPDQASSWWVSGGGWLSPSSQASAWNVPLMVWSRHVQKIQSSCPPCVPTASPPLNTHIHSSNTSSSTLLYVPPNQKDKIAWPPVSHLIPPTLPRSFMLRERTTPVDYVEVGVNKTVLQTAAAQRKRHRWLIHGLLIFKSAFIDQCTVTIYFLFHPHALDSSSIQTKEMASTSSLIFH